MTLFDPKVLREAVQEDEMSRHHRQGYTYKHACDEVVRQLNYLRSLPRCRGKLDEELAGMQRRLQEESAHIVAVWD